MLKRWLRRPAFRHALRGVRDALRFQSDLHLAAASASAAQVLQQCTRINADPNGKPDLTDADQLKLLNARMSSMVQLLRMAHLRTRFSVAEEQAPLLDALKRFTRLPDPLELLRKDDGEPEDDDEDDDDFEDDDLD